MPKLPSTKTNAHIIEIERLRRAIPLRALLELMTQSAVTGRIPILDLNGKPTGEFKPLRPDKQVDLAMSLINKALPDRAEAPMLPEDTPEGKVLDVRNLSDEELEALAVAKPAALQEPEHPGAPESRPELPGPGGDAASPSDNGAPAP